MDAGGALGDCFGEQGGWERWRFEIGFDDLTLEPPGTKRISRYKEKIRPKSRKNKKEEGMTRRESGEGLKVRRVEVE